MFAGTLTVEPASWPIFSVVPLNPSDSSDRETELSGLGRMGGRSCD